MNHSLFRCFIVLCAMAATACGGETASDDVDDVDVDVVMPGVDIEASDIFLKLDGVVGEPTAPRTSVFR